MSRRTGKENRIEYADILRYQKTMDKRLGDSLMKKYEPLVKRKCRIFFLRREDKDDLYQEARIGLYEALIGFKPENGSFVSFACLCIHRKCVTMVRASNRKKNEFFNESLSLDTPAPAKENDRTPRETRLDVLETPESGLPDAIVMKNEDYRQCNALFHKLFSTIERLSFCRWLIGESYRAISKMYHWPEKSVDNAVNRAKKKLRKYVMDYGDVDLEMLVNYSKAACQIA